MPDKLTEFILENDLNVKKPKKADDEEEIGFFQWMWKLIWTKPKVPDSPYYDKKLNKSFYLFAVHPLF